ncbi:septal ring lytic transglycosylase RlpA family protein [bacterium]|nr:septal ring lytic transglycosylase RlpA family protein [bacterium]
MKGLGKILPLVILVVLISACSGYNGVRSANNESQKAGGADVVNTLFGRASWYGKGFHGRRTANGERYNMYAHTAAHKTLPFGTYVRVTNLVNDKTTLVRINDRGPFVKGRVLDLSLAAAKDVGIYQTGVGEIKLEVLKDTSPLVSAVLHAQKKS